MPGNSFPLPVRVGGKIDLFRLLHLFAKSGKDISLASYGNVFGLIIVFRVDSHLTLWQIPHMTVACHHFVTGAQKFFYRLNLGR